VKPIGIMTCFAAFAVLAASACSEGHGDATADLSSAIHGGGGSATDEAALTEGADTFPSLAMYDDAAGPVLESTFDSPSGPLAFRYRVIDGDAVAEGDILLGEEVAAGVRSSTSVGRHWPRAVVPYVVDANLPAQERVTAAIAHWEAKTKLRFVPRTTERDYVHFRPGGGCSSAVGQAGGRQSINLTTSENASTVAAIGIDRTVEPERTYFFYARGFATAGTPMRAAGQSAHFRYTPAPGQTPASLVDVAFASNGHLFAFYKDGTVSEGDREDFTLHAPPRPYVLPDGKSPADVVGFAIDASDHVHAFYRNGTFSIGTVTDLASVAAPATFTVVDGKTPADVALVDVAKDGAFHAFYREPATTPDGGVAPPRVLQSTWGTAAALAEGSGLLKTTFPGNCPTGATIHEIGHAVGLWHEQTRHDRSEHVRIVWENITPANRFNFDRHSRIIGADSGGYDFGSIMHYGPKAFSANGGETIVPIGGGTFTEQRTGLSDTDLVGVRAMYP
jgi:hypothetical protein